MKPGHICILYDCLFPYTIGGAERWYRELAERFARAGYGVTYLTLRQWDEDEAPRIEGVEVIPVGPRLALYDADKRRIWPPLRFGIGVFWHLLLHGGRYTHVHGASFPFFSILAAGVLMPFRRFALSVDWHEVWSRKYWREYLGPLGWIGWTVQQLCATIPHKAFVFSRLHGKRLRKLGREPALLSGEYAGPSSDPAPALDPPVFVYAGRMIPEKRVPLLIEAFAIAHAKRTNLRLRLFGKGPERATVAKRIAELELGEAAELSGFVEQAELDAAMASAVAIVQPSSREGYGMVVVEASARGVPAIVVQAEDNAAVELVEAGVNGEIAAASPDDLARAMLAVAEKPAAYRALTRQWYLTNQERLSIDTSVKVLIDNLDQ